MRRRWLIAAAALLLAAAGAIGGYVLYIKQQGEDVRGSSTIEFVTTTATTRPPPPPPPPTTTTTATGPKRPPPQGIVWPFFGYDAQHTHFVPQSPIEPPFRAIWHFKGQSLLEFPPAIAYGRLFFATNHGLLYAISERTGRRAWKQSVGRCVAASPAVAGTLVIEAFLNKPPCNSTRLDEDGLIAAYTVGTGRRVWSQRLGPSESSPLVSGGVVYVGDWRGRVVALEVATGKILWRFQTGDKVKGAVSISGNRLFVGSYDGAVYCLNAKTGKQIWRAESLPTLGGRGTFYSTPAVAYGRVYIGSTDGKLYSYGAASGQVRFAQSLGGYVYGSPAVWRERVYAGSYSGDFYALDAATGDVKWRFHANGPISGSATVLHGIVYFATLKGITYGLDATTGKQLWTFPDGKYSPVVADDKRLYLVGYTRIYALVPR